MVNKLYINESKQGAKLFSNNPVDSSRLLLTSQKQKPLTRKPRLWERLHKIPAIILAPN